MAHAVPINIEIISDDDEPQQRDGDRDGEAVSVLSTPLTVQFKRPRTDPGAKSPPILLIEDDPTPRKPAIVESTLSDLFVPETLGVSKPEVPIVECGAGVLGPQTRPVSADEKICGTNRLISLDSDSESEIGSGMENCSRNGTTDSGFDATKYPCSTNSSFEHVYSLGNVDSSQISGNSSLNLSASQHDISQVNEQLDSDSVRLDQMGDTLMQTIGVTDAVTKIVEKEAGKKRLTKEGRTRMVEEKKQKKEQEKLEKEALKAEAARMKNLEKERQKWEKGRLSIKSIVAEIDTKVVEGSVGGHLLSRFSEKGVTFHITSNPIERSIVWTMSIPEEILQLSSKGTIIPYVLLVFEAEEFCNILLNGSLMDHLSRVRSLYPSHTICYLTNRLAAFIDKREQAHYKNPNSSNGWKRPPVEEIMANLATHFSGVHSRLCIDEAEVAEHVVGLTSSLAACQFRKKLTRLSVNANGSFIPKDCSDRNLIKKSVWLKALVAIPKVQPRFAVAIGEKYPTMKSLLSIYMDPSKSVHEKEFMLKDIQMEGLFGDERRVGEMCSKRVYRVLTAQSGGITTDDVECGADFFVPTPGD